ncbi:MAG TPA: ATP-binding protein [Saprospiraceae bacterium]|nr:ATP-binding protein [Saprospiraceae bacterium]
MKRVITTLLSLILFTVAFQTLTSAQQNSSMGESMQESLDVATQLMISKQSKSAVLITGKLLERLEKEGKYNAPFGLKVQLIHGSALVSAEKLGAGLDFLLKLKETSQAKKQWDVFAESCRVIASVLEYAEQKEGSLSNLREAQATISQYHLDSIYPNFAVRISSWHRIFGDRDSSVFYAHEAIRTAPQFGKVFEVAEGHLLLGLNLKHADPQGAISHYKEAALLYRKVKVFYTFCLIHLNMAELNLAMGKSREAMANIDTAFLYYPLATGNNIEQLFRAYILKGNAFQQLGQLDSAIFYLKTGHKMELESLQSLNLEKIVEIDNKYNVKQKVKELEAKNLEIQTGNDRLNLLMVLISMIFVFAGILAFFYLRLRKANQITREQSKQLKSLDTAKSHFFANVSHELRTPLALMLGPIGTLLKDKQLTDKQANLLQLAQHSSKQLEQLVTEILDLGKLEMGKMELDEKPTEVAPFFRSYFAQFESLAESRHIDFSFDIAVGDGVVTNLDQAKCRQILNNLLSNAFKFTPAGERVEATLSLNNGTIQLSVADTGPGIHPDDLPHVFNRYFQTTRPDKPAEGGTGIGLALCHEYAHLFGGKIEVKSMLGQGTTFRVWIPVKRADNANISDVAPKILDLGLKSAPAPIATPVASADKARPTILVVEDNPDLQAYIRVILSEKYNVVSADNGQTALGVMRDELGVMSEQAGAQIAHHSSLITPDLVLSDLMMPVMDGLQLLEKLKSSDATRHIPVIMLTARAEARDKLKALRIGVDDYMTKPFEEEELLARIENLLRNQSVRKQEAPSSPAPETTRPQVSEEDQQWLEGFEAYVQKHLSSDILTVSALAGTFAMSDSTLQRQLKRLTGLSPIQYLQEMRLDEGRKLLETRRYNSIGQVAAQVGFQDARSFSRSYKQRFGKLPSEMMGE